MTTSPSPDKRKPTPNGRVKPEVASIDVGAPVEACAVGAGRLVVVASGPEGATCRIRERGEWSAELAAPPGLHRLRTDGAHLVACVGTDRIVTATRREDGWTALQPLPLPEVFQAVRDVMLRDDLIVVDSVADGFAIYEFSRGRWLLRHQAPARAMKRLGRPVAVNARHDILVELGKGYAILARDVVGGWTKGSPLRLSALHRGWTPAAIETVHFTDHTLALGSPRDATDAPGYAAPVTGRTLPDSGTVFVSSRGDDGAWSPFVTLTPPRPRAHERFGAVLSGAPSGSGDGALLVASVHAQSPAVRPFVFARDEEGSWQLRSQLPDLAVGWVDMDGDTVFHAARGGETVTLHTFGDDLLDVPPPRRSRRRRARRPTAEISWILPEQDGGMGELLAAHGDRVAVTVGDAVHVLRFDDGEPVTEHVVTHPDELVPGALAVHGGRVAIIWEDLGDRVATPQILARADDGTWQPEPMGPPRGEDGGWAEPCVVLADDWLVYSRRGDADGHPSWICGWRRDDDGWTQRFEVRWPRAPHSIDLDGERLLVASEWEDRVEVCALTDEGPGPAALVTEHGGPSVFHGDAVLVGRRDGIHAFVPGDGWTEAGMVELPREVTDDLVADGERVYAASSLVGGTGGPSGEVHVLRVEDGAYVSCLSFRDYCQGVEGYDVGGTLAVAGDRVLVGFEHRFHQRGGIQVATLDGLAPDADDDG